MSPTSDEPGEALAEPLRRAGEDLRAVWAAELTHLAWVVLWGQDDDPSCCETTRRKHDGQ